MLTAFDPEILLQVYKPPLNSHKGQNGRLLVIGGSELFHTSIFWAADVASKVVDLVHFTSPANENNELIRQKIKSGFWNGIVVDWREVEDYIREDDVTLIGPGMTRSPETKEITNELVGKYADKKWVVDGGALQMVDPALLNGNMIVTPHRGEWERLEGHNQPADLDMLADALVHFSVSHGGLTIIAKGPQDVVCQGETCVRVAGGNPGMTKGGTGDVLAGLVAALYCNNEAWVAAQVASLVNKKAGEALEERVGVYFSAGDLVTEVPKTLLRLTR